MLSLPVASKANQSSWFGQAIPAAQPFILSQLAMQQQRPLVVLCARADEAEQLQESLAVLAPELPVLRLPDYETLPYDHFSPSQDIISLRLECLYQLPLLQQGIVLVPAPTLMQRLCPRQHILQQSLMLKKGQTLNLEAFRQQLSGAGYLHSQQVFQHGEFSVRGALIDLYPMGSKLPVRIELFDDQIESLRLFDPDSQRTLQQITQLTLLPGHEIPRDEQSIALFRQQFREHFDLAANKCTLYRDVSEGQLPAGIEAWMPLFFEANLDCLFDYLPSQSLLVHLPGLEAAIDQHWQEVHQRYHNLGHDLSRPIMAPEQLYLAKDQLFGQIKHWQNCYLQTEALEANAERGRYNLPILPGQQHLMDHRSQAPLAALMDYALATDHRILFVAETPGRRESLLDWLKSAGIKPDLFTEVQAFFTSSSRHGLCVAPLELGFILPEQGIEILAESQLFGQQQVNQRRKKKNQQQAEQFIRNLGELKEQDLVVHLDHGIGRYLGLINIETEGDDAEFLQLEYAGGDKLYVPVSALNMISRYSGGDQEKVALSKLGSERWGQAKRKAAEKVRDTAAELLEIYARRQAQQGFATPVGGEDYRRFAAGFAFEETEDQAKAINAVMQDMQRTQPMDRLVCGDVGFGKTEVAMRAAFMAVHAGRQVAVLVPTTLLAQQHYDNFKDRFADWPVKVELLSRSKAKAAADKIEEGLQTGQIDIIIATHKLLSDKIQFRQLGLLIIDEEHRFGVEQKEKIKKMRTQIDILTLTATPIPRTLNMAMSQIRDLSIIATAPARRLSVKTFVRQQDDALVREAILREILRGGQVYYLHNEVKTIDRALTHLSQLVPEARIEIGHGQMSERQLERVMSDFHHKRFNVLLCTTIVETGIDIPNANTIIIHRADKFGLAQLHQLRGRVGRSHHQAYAWLLTPDDKNMTKDAQKRLDAIAATQDLGAGFSLASHDLEIRGAGELLGGEQSGSMESIGFSLYMELLERTVKAMQKGETPNLSFEDSEQVDINLHLPALFPSDYMPDVSTRLNFYKRISSSLDQEQRRELQVELIDRFGLLPEPAKNLFRLASLQQQAQHFGIRKIDFSERGGVIDFGPKTRLDPICLVKLVQKHSADYRLQGQSLKILHGQSTAEKRFGTMEQLLANFVLTEDKS